MKKTMYFFVAVLFAATCIISCTNNSPKNTVGTFTDSRDGHVYKTVSINGQVWMAENLAFKSDSSCWAFDNNQSNVAKYGYLYNWETAKSVCPSGWHLPSKSEFETLLSNYGGDRNSKANYTALILNGSSGFSALLGGGRHKTGNFEGAELDGFFWSATGDNKLAWVLNTRSDRKNALLYNLAQQEAFSVRCVKDK